MEAHIPLNDRIAVNLMVWTDQFRPEHVPVLDAILSWGYKGVEVPLLAEEAFDTDWLRTALDQRGLNRSTSTAMPPGASLVVEDELEAGERWLTRCLEATARLGGNICCGPLLAPVGRFTGARPTRSERDLAVRSLKRLAARAEALQVTLALEPLNRFETYLINTAADGFDLISEVGSPRVLLLLDTFHMNIEERSISGAIRHVHQGLAHFHCSANDRGPVGRGHMPWDSIIATLKALNYPGWLVVESFAGHLPKIAKAAAMWRDVASSPEELAEASAIFLLDATRRI